MTDPHIKVVVPDQITVAQIRQCPHYIIHPDHYRQDGTCRCNDETHTVMREWGYEWKNEAWC